MSYVQDLVVTGVQCQLFKVCHMSSVLLSLVSSVSRWFQVCQMSSLVSPADKLKKSQASIRLSGVRYAVLVYVSVRLS